MAGETERKILAVDRDLVMHDIIRLALENKVLDKSRLLFARGIKEAEERFEENNFDLVILSLDLVDGHGLDYLKKLRKERNYKGSIMILTEDNRPGMQKACEEFELTGYFYKPLMDIEQFAEKVLEVLDRSNND